MDREDTVPTNIWDREASGPSAVPTFGRREEPPLRLRERIFGGLRFFQKFRNAGTNEAVSVGWDGF